MERKEKLQKMERKDKQKYLKNCRRREEKEDGKKKNSKRGREERR